MQTVITALIFFKANLGTTPSQKSVPSPLPKSQYRTSSAAASGAQMSPSIKGLAFGAYTARNPTSSVTSDSRSSLPTECSDTNPFPCGTPPVLSGDRRWIESQGEQIQNQTLGE
jgi:hypothetical protein